MLSLKDKLLKAGVVTEEDAKRAEAEKAKAPERTKPQGTPRPPDRDRASSSSTTTNADRRPRDNRSSGASNHAARAQPNSHSSGRTVEKREPRLPKLPPMVGSKEANRQASKRQLELDRKIREKVLSSQVTYERGDTAFYFVTRKNKLRRLELTVEQAAKLERGELAVVERPDPDKLDHSIVPAAVAEELLLLSARSVRFLNKEGAKVGFLSDQEIHDRASEATPGDESDANEPDEVEAGATIEAEGGASPAEEHFITVRRAPLP
jgi:uncharacterized protein YaiL (DUF2058 family)